MAGSAKRSEMVEKSFCEELGLGLGLGFGFGGGCGGEHCGSSSGGHLMRGLPGTESHDWSEEKRRLTV
jgi:hypothetical protein